MNNHNQKYILSFIAKLLDPKTAVDKFYFTSPSQIFWDGLVKMGSKHLVLPAINGALKRKKLAHHLPKDLMIFLKEISDLNYERNKAIKKQIFFLSNILKKNKINHVFLKGAAMLIFRPFNTLEERMIGDIDILIPKHDLIKAKNILFSNGFSYLYDDDVEFTEGLKEKPKKDLNRIVHSNYIAAVELHIEPLEFKNIHHFSSELITKNIIYIDGFPIPNQMNLWRHAIFNWQYNDNGFHHNNFSFRTFMDVVHLESINFDNNSIIQPSIVHFYSLCSLFIPRYENRNYISSTIYNYKILFPKLEIVSNYINKCINRILTILDRLILLLKSKTYRQRIFQNPKLFFKKITYFLGK
ncbi:MAG: hypothetical protein CL824_02705 [Crocinitomicaceae bacterium]|nr:hypothetical protein [Crocinitomicaceae bacterium]